MKNIQLLELSSTDTTLIDQIAAWYLEEWKIPVEKTRNNLLAVCADPLQTQVVLMINDTPVATGGVYHQVGICDREPRLKVYSPWLALVYTVPEHRRKGYGAMLCVHLQERCGQKGITSLHLFTDTAERLYENLGWKVFERLETGGRNIALMHIKPDNVQPSLHR